MIPRIMIAAVGSGSGKTTISCALLQALKDQNRNPSAFKCGPDYIDPMFHQKILGIPSRNLDLFFTDEKVTKALFLDGAAKRGISVIEGAMGLYDGLGGISEEASSYHLACITKTPIILVVNAHGMARSLLPLIAGFLEYDKAHLIKGVLLNRISGMFYQTIKAEIETNLPVKVLGYFPKQTKLNLESRHLGLKLPDEIKGLKEQIRAAAKVLLDTIELDQVICLAEEAVPLEEGNNLILKPAAQVRENVPIGIAADEAFCFYYEDNIRLLERLGAELIPFSPLHDKDLPKGIKGMIFGGGYPELYAKALSENKTMKAAIVQADRQGMPSIAEGGGFMYLHEELKTKDESSYQMTGLIKGKCRYIGTLVRFGYICVQEKEAQYLPLGKEIRGHEFHYFDSTQNGSSCIAKKPLNGRNWPCIQATDHQWWGFPHLYYYSNPEYAKSFIERAQNYAKTTRYD